VFFRSDRFAEMAAAIRCYTMRQSASHARVAKLADARDLKYSHSALWRFVQVCENALNRWP
jgi:hypothetical protein